MLLPFVVPGDGARAQPDVLRTITNIAEASWKLDETTIATDSNAVVVDVTARPPDIRSFRQTQNAGTQLDFLSPICDGSARSPNSVGGGFQNPNGQAVRRVAEVEQTEKLRAGENLIFEVQADAANRDPNAIEQMDTVISNASGDHEIITIYETSENSGVFVGSMPTVRAPPAPIQENCELSVQDGDTIRIAASLAGETEIVIATQVEVLVDPFGIVFDSETAEPVTGARVTLIDNRTGLPATVFAEDGVTPWPSTVISGQAIVDGDGNIITMGPGEYWFPLTFLGEYRLQIEPPEPYSAPSVVAQSELRRLPHPDGRELAILDASFGAPFLLDNPTPVQIDIPLDRPSLDISLTKTASRQQAQPGDVVFYTLTATNSDPTRIKRSVILTDTPSTWLRLRRDTVRLDGAAAPDAVTTNADGSRLTIALGDIEGGASRRVTYAMTVRPDAPPGEAINRADVTDSVGRRASANAVVDIERDSIADRFTIIGRVSAGPCSLDETRAGIPGVRVMLQDGSFAITDADGRYHFEGVVPGTHVVQVSSMTLPDGAEFVDCHRSTRSAGSANSRFVIGHGGGLVVADFHADVPASQLALAALFAETTPGSSIARKINDIAEGNQLSGRVESTVRQTASRPSAAQPTLAPTTDWLALGDGEDGFLTPEIGHNPRAPAIRVAIRHRKGQKIVLRANGEEVSGYAFEGTRAAPNARYAVSLWRGVPLRSEKTVLEADVISSFGGVRETFTRDVFFTNSPAKVEFLREQSNLIADGRTRPVVVVRVLDRNNRPLREGISGEFSLSAPYESAEQLDRQQLNQLTGLAPSSARWVVEGSDGLARIELAPTMVSGSLRLEFKFDDGEIARSQEIEAWIEPGDIEWTIIGLVEGSIGAKTVADNMERAGQFDSDLGDNARVALYAKGRVLGKYLITLAYDSAKQREDQRVLGTLDPQAYYTVFADGSSRRFDAASREKLYVRVETSTFYALYGDFETGFDQTRLARYNRTATGVKGEVRLGQVQAQGFAAEISTRLRRDEIQGQGISGPYALGARSILANSERVTLEIRDRFRPELIISTRELVRFIDYDLDPLSATITFAEPVLSRDFDLNPQFIVVEYETDGLGDAQLNAGVRADWTSANGAIRVGANAITDKGEGARTDIGTLDLRARLGETTEVRAEVGLSRRDDEQALGWLVEAQHQTGSLDLLAYARQLDNDYGVGQQNGGELGRRKVGLDGRVLLSEELSVTGSVWHDESLTDSARRRAAQVQFGYAGESTDLRVGLAHFNDRLADGSSNTSTILDGGVTQRFFGNDLELSAAGSIALGNAESIDLPARYRFGARYALSNDVRLVGQYEIASGEDLDSRTLRGGVEVTPWTGGRVVSTIGQQDIGEFGKRSFAAFGLAQSIQVSPNLTIDATLDGNRTLNGAPDAADLINPDQPAASGGQLTGGTLFEDFTAVTFGAAWRKDRWSATARGEYRDGELANRTGATFGAIRQLGEGSIVGSGATWTRATSDNGARTEILDASVAFAHRPDESEFAMLGKLEFRSDKVTDAVAGEAGAAGRTALTVDGDARSSRLIASLSTNWSPRGWEKDQNGVRQQVRRDEYSLFLGARYNLDEFEGVEFSGTTVMAGVDARFGIGESFELGATGTVRANLEDDVTSFAYGPQIGFTPTDGVLLTVGYNVEGFRDADFAGARSTEKGLYASIRMKFDTNTFGFLGLGR